MGHRKRLRPNSSRTGVESGSTRSPVARDRPILSTGGDSSLLINVQHLARLCICLMLYSVCMAGISV
ncbi:hypothetical protein BDW69DRAFT_179363 [Aspergillus filifer]